MGKTPKLEILNPVVTLTVSPAVTLLVKDLLTVAVDVLWRCVSLFVLAICEDANFERGGGGVKDFGRHVSRAVLVFNVELYFCTFARLYRPEAAR